MTAVVILNIVFAAFVVVGMLTLLGRAIVADRRATGASFGPGSEVRAVRPQFSTPAAPRGRRLDPAV